MATESSTKYETEIEVLVGQTEARKNILLQSVNIYVNTALLSHKVTKGLHNKIHKHRI